MSTAVVPFLGTAAERKSGRPAKSMGIPRPVAQQSTVVEKVAVDKTAWEMNERRDPDTLFAPNGSKAAHDVYAHEILLGRLIPGAKHHLGYPHVYVTSCVNGIPREDEDQYFFYGVAATQADVSRGGESDNLVTTILVGTASIINQGCENINAGDLLYVDMNPYVVVYGKNREIIPAIDHPGVPRDKFRPQVRPWPHGSITSYFAARRREIAKVMGFGVDDDGKINTQLYLEPSKARIDEVFNKLQIPVSQSNVMTHTIPKNELWAACVAYSTILVNGLTVHLRELQNFMGFFQEVSKHSSQWWSSFGGRTRTTDAYIGRGGDLEHRTVPNRLATHSKRATELKYVEGDDDAILVALRGVTELIGVLNEMADNYKADFLARFERMIIGKALTTSVPGQQLDVLLGYFS